jgi:ParB/RepB/Spo0J family partition protein
MQSERNAATAVTPTEPNLRSVPAARIVVPDGFNPRGRVVEDRELAQLADSIRQYGVLQPIRVRATDGGEFVLIAGERRYRAAIKAGVTELPVIVRSAGAGGGEEEADLLVEAVIENDLRVDLDPLARARGYQRLLDSGLTIKGIAERLHTTLARVKEHLQILKLPEPVQQRVGGGEVPLRAIKPLEALARIHPGLADAAAGEVLNASEDVDDDPYTWADLERDPLSVATHAGELPEGVYRAAGTSYPADRFALSEKARKDLAALEKLIGTTPTIRFEHQELEQARALGAAHGERWDALIVGADVASQLAGDYIARCLKTQRANERRRHHQDAADSHNGEAAGADEEARREAQRAERDAQRQAREEATALNTEVGRAIYSTVSRVKVDERTLKLLATVDVTGELGDLAMRGARYGFPGWVEEAAQRNGKTKLVYVEQRAGAEQRAREYLAGAASAGEIAGRQLALVAMAVFADQDAVAMSNRSWHQVKRSGPWAGEFDELLDELVREKLPASAIALLEAKLVERREHRAQTAAEREQRTAALGRLEGVEERIATLDADGLAAVEQDLDVAFPGYHSRLSELRRLIQARINQLTSESEAR